MNRIGFWQEPTPRHGSRTGARAAATRQTLGRLPARAWTQTWSWWPYIAWYNGTWLHSALGYMTPDEFETTGQEVLKQVA
jgi:hypothetical protein